MKKVGDLNLALVPNEYRSRAYYEAMKQRVLVVCKRCGAHSRKSQAEIKKHHKLGFICFECRAKERKELTEAITGLALRKYAQRTETKNRKAKR